MLEQHTLFPLSDAVKRCTKCLTEQPLSEFYPIRRGRPELTARCKACTRIDNLVNRQAHLEKRRAADRAYHAAKAAARPPKPPKPVLTEKACNRCHAVKSIGDYYLITKNKERRSAICKLCSSEQCAEYRRKNAEMLTEYARRYREGLEQHWTPVAPPTEKVCTRCHVAKPIDDFYPHHKFPGKYASRCKACSLALTSEWSRQNRERNREYAAQWRASAPPEAYGVDKLPTKKCARCQVVKPCEDFRWKIKARGHRQAYCRPCSNIRTMEYAKAHPEKIRAYDAKSLSNPEIRARRTQYNRAWAAANPDKEREKQKRYKENHPELKEYWREQARKNRDANRETYAARKRAWSVANRDRENENRRRRLQERFDADPMFEARYRLDVGMATAIGDSLRGTKRGRHWYDLVGYTLEDLMAHLESQFQEGMTWANRTNKGLDGWHIDHIRPRASFSYTSADDLEFKECWSLANLQPLWAVENLKKRDKWFDASVQTL